MRKRLTTLIQISTLKKSIKYWERKQKRIEKLVGTVITTDIIRSVYHDGDDCYMCQLNYNDLGTGCRQCVIGSECFEAPYEKIQRGFKRLYKFSHRIKKYKMPKSFANLHKQMITYMKQLLNHCTIE
jgi:hypothetical protein